MPDKKVKIKIEGVEKSFSGNGHHVLSNVDLEIYEGEMFCILGPSGCGKTTLLHIMSGYEKSTKGEVLIDGRKLNKPHPDYIVLFQDYGLFPWRSVLGNVEYGLEIKGISKDMRREKAMELIKMVGLSPYVNYYPGELSGGMQQRVAIARALAVDPDIIFMDEPFGALDAMTRLKMQEDLERIWQQKNKTVIMVTHDISEAVYLADRVAVMSSRQGKINSIIDIELERPRYRTGHNFMMIQHRIFKELEMGVQSDMEYCI